MNYYAFLDVIDELIMHGFICTKVNRYEFECQKNNVAYRVIMGLHGIDVLSFTGEEVYAIAPRSVVGYMTARRAA